MDHVIGGTRAGGKGKETHQCCHVFLENLNRRQGTSERFISDWILPSRFDAFVNKLCFSATCVQLKNGKIDLGPEIELHFQSTRNVYFSYIL